MLTAFSMISMLIKTAMALRLAMAPYRPIQNSTAPSTRKWLSVNPMVLILPANHYRAYDRYEQHQRSNFKGQHVAVAGGAVQELADIDDVVGRQNARAGCAIRGTATGMRGGVLAKRHGEDDRQAKHGADDCGQPPLLVV